MRPGIGDALCMKDAVSKGFARAFPRGHLGKGVNRKKELLSGYSSGGPLRHRGFESRFDGALYF